MNYRCEPCDMPFNGLIPYEAHLRSAKHAKKTGTSSSKSNIIKLDKFIKEFKNEYKCILCNLTLNSSEQAQTHVYGKKHRSLAGGKIGINTSFSPRFSSEIENGNASIVSRTPQNSTSDSANEFTFTFRGIEIKDVMANVTVFGSDDPLVF